MLTVPYHSLTQTGETGEARIGLSFQVIKSSGKTGEDRKRSAPISFVCEGSAQVLRHGDAGGPIRGARLSSLHKHVYFG